MPIRATVKHGEFSIPLVSGVVEEDRFNLRRYLGGCFFVDSRGMIATCKHVVAAMPEGERLAIVYPRFLDKRFGVTDLKSHPKADLAFGIVPDIRSNNFYKPFDDGDNLLGRDVSCWGMIVKERQEHDLKMLPRLHKGYVTRYDDSNPDSVLLSAFSVCELSFAVAEGYSGYPVIYVNERARDVQLFGMVYGNIESRIMAYSRETVNDSGAVCYVERQRIIELAVVHTASDIRRAASDLGLTSIFK